MGPKIRGSLEERNHLGIHRKSMDNLKKII